MLSHLSFFMLGVIAPLVIMLTLGKRSPLVRDQAVEALNFHITTGITVIASLVLILVFVGVVLLPVVLVAGAVLTIIAAVESYQGKAYRYPLTIRFVS